MEKIRQVGIIVLIAFFGTFAMPAMNSEAGRSGGSGYSSSSSRSSGGSWGGSSKPSYSPPVRTYTPPSPVPRTYTPLPTPQKTAIPPKPVQVQPTVETKTQQGWGKKTAVAGGTAVVGTAAVATATNAQSVPRDKAADMKTKAISAEQSKVAMQEYQARQAKFSKPEDTSPLKTTPTLRPVQNYRSSTGYAYTPTTRVVRVNHYYNNWNPPIYVYSSPRSFGFWDTMFLYHMLSSNNHSFFYHHQSDPYVQDFLREARRNDELQRQVNSLQRQVNEMKGQPVDSAYLPQGADPDIAYTQKYVESNSGKFYDTPSQNARQEVPTKKSGSFGKFVLYALIAVCIGGVIYYFVFVRKY